MSKQESNVYIGVLLAIGILLLMVATFLYMAVKYHRSRLLLQRQQVVAEIQAIENDRKRIAADLHDEIGSLLTYVKLKMGNMKKEAALQNDAANVMQHLDRMHNSLLAITNDLLPNSLAQNGLIATIEELIADTGAAFPLKFVFTHSLKDETVIPPHAGIHIYRVITELVQNTLKHANASLVTISINSKTRHLLLHYADNGEGFNLRNTLKHSSGFGLKNINSRVELLHGQIKLFTEKGKGVQYEIKIPLKQYVN